MKHFATILLLLVCAIAAADDEIDFALRGITAQTSNSEIERVLDVYTLRRNQNGIVRLHSRVEELFKKDDPPRYAGLTLKFCHALSAADFDRTLYGRSQYEINSEIALSALNVCDDRVPLNAELELLADVGRPDPAKPQADQDASRQQGLAAWIHTLERLYAEADKPLPEAYVQMSGWVPPGFEHDVPWSGASPEVIQDPVRRKQYADAIQAQREQGETYNRITVARRARDWNLPLFRRYVKAGYQDKDASVLHHELDPLLDHSTFTADERTGLMTDPATSKKQ